MAIAYDKAQRQIIRFMSGAEKIGRTANRSSIDRQPVHGNSEASKQQPQINKQARRETLLSLDDFTQCHTSTVASGNCATWQRGNLATLSTEQLATGNVASGDVAIFWRRAVAGGFGN